MIPRTFRDLLERKGDHRALERADKTGQAFLLLFPRTWHLLRNDVACTFNKATQSDATRHDLFLPSWGLSISSPILYILFSKSGSPSNACNLILLFYVLLIDYKITYKISINFKFYNIYIVSLNYRRRRISSTIPKLASTFSIYYYLKIGKVLEKYKRIY